jgi:tetratricopeptide (TPR) repeat protein
VKPFLSHGTGYAVGDDLVLTARHVVAAGAPCLIRPAGAREPVPAEIVWLPDHGPDAALLRVPSTPWRDAPDAGAARWGRVEGNGVRCWALGFPWSQATMSGARDLETMRGTIDVTTGVLGGRYHVDVMTSTPVPLTPPSTGAEPARPRSEHAARSAWQGISGAVLLGSGREFLGVLVDDPTAFGSKRLQAVPVARLLEDEGFAELVGAYPHHLEPVADRGETAELDAPGAGLLRPAYEELDPKTNPADYRLLRAEYRQVPFLGREQELGSLLDWCRGDDRFAVALVTGDGGSGKTRLGIELCRELTKVGWSAGFARMEELRHARPLQTEVVWPTLMVIDYPEGLTDEIGRLIAHLARPHRRGARLRILFLDRAPGSAEPTPATGLLDALPWWSDLRRLSKGEIDAAVGEPVQLEAGRLAPADRGRHAEAALQAFGRGTTAALPDFADDGYSNPLKVHLAVLLALRGETAPTAAATLRQFVAREQGRWRGRLAAHGITDIGTKAPDHAVVVATLATPSPDEAVDLLTVVGSLAAPGDTARRIRTAEWLRELFPGTHRIAPLTPDLLAEQLLEDTGAALTPLVLALYDLPERTPEHLVRMVHTLQLATRQRGRVHARDALLALLAGRLPSLVEEADQAPRSALPALLETAIEQYIGHDTEQRLAATAMAVRHHGLVGSADRLRCRVAELAAAGHDAVGDHHARADRLTDVTAYRYALGDLDVATQSAARAEAAYGAVRGQGTEPRARSAYNLGTCLARGGQFKAAETHLTVAVQSYEHLTQGDERHRPALVDALANLAACHTARNEQQAAARALARAIEVSGMTDEMVTGVGEMLALLARSLADAPVEPTVLTCAPESYRSPVGADPDWRREDGLVRVLEDQAACLVRGFADHVSNGRRASASPLRRALRFRVGGHHEAPDALEFAEHLRTLARAQSIRDHYDLALVPAIESVALLRRFVVPKDPSLRWMLARGIEIVADYHRWSGRSEEALEYGRELVEQRRALLPEDFLRYPHTGVSGAHTAVRPPSPGSALASALDDLGDLLDLTGRTAEAAEAYREAVALLTAIAARHPEARPQLATTSMTLAVNLYELNRLPEAAQVTRSAVEIFLELSEEDTQYTIKAAEALRFLGGAVVLSGAEGLDESMAAIARAVDLLGRGTERSREELLSRAESMANLSLVMISTERTREALALAEQALAMCRGLPEPTDDSNRVLAGALVSISNCALQLRHAEQAVMAAEEAVALLMGLDADMPVLLLRALSLNVLADSLQSAGHLAEAEPRAQEAVALFGVMQDLGFTYPGLAINRAEALISLARCRLLMGRADESLDSLTSAELDLRGWSTENPLIRLVSIRKHLIHGRALLSLQRPGEALAELEASLKLLRTEEGSSPATRLHLAEVYGNVGACHLLLGRPDKALTLLEGTAETLRALDTGSTDELLASVLGTLAECRMALGDLSAAQEAVLEAQALLGTGGTPQTAFLRGVLLLALGHIHRALDRPFEAQVDQAVAIFSELPLDVARNRLQLARALTLRALHHWPADTRDGLEEAAATAMEAARVFRSCSGSGSPDALIGLGSVLNIAGACQTRLDRWSEALDLFCEATESFVRAGSGNPAVALDHGQAERYAGYCFLVLEEPARAVPRFRGAVELLEHASEDVNVPTVLIADTVSRLAETLADLGQVDDALNQYQKAVTLQLPLAKEDPAEHASALIEILEGCADVLRSLGREQEAVETEQLAATWRQGSA